MASPYPVTYLQSFCGFAVLFTLKESVTFLTLNTRYEIQDKSRVEFSPGQDLENGLTNWKTQNGWSPRIHV